MIERLLIFGASGDLAGRYLLPALAALLSEKRLPDGFEVVGAATQPWNDERFRQQASERLTHHAPTVPSAAREDLVRRLSYRSVDFASREKVRDVLDATHHRGAPIAAYLALPTRVLAPAVKGLEGVGLPPDSRIALEKPFGEDLESAIALNQLLTRLCGPGEAPIFRVDYVLGLATVQNLIGLRLASPILEPAWNSAFIEQIDVLWEETLGLEGRAGFYDRAGALRDVVQNHMFQVLCLVAMEPPPVLRERELRDRKLDVLRAIRPLSPADVAMRTRRARYTAGTLANDADGRGRTVPSYVDEPGVDPARNTETFAELALELDNPRWAGTRFLLRAGKALANRRREVVVKFRPARHLPFADPAGPLSAEQRIGIDGPYDLALTLVGKRAEAPPVQLPFTLKGAPPRTTLPAYARVLLDLLEGDSTLSVRGDEAEQAWRVLMPVLEVWGRNHVPMEEYVAGSDGPHHVR